MYPWRFSNNASNETLNPAGVIPGIMTGFDFLVDILVTADTVAHRINNCYIANCLDLCHHTAYATRPSHGMEDNPSNVHRTKELVFSEF